MKFEMPSNICFLRKTQRFYLFFDKLSQVLSYSHLHCITQTDHNTGRPIEVSVLKRFHVILWEQAATEFEVRLLIYNIAPPPPISSMMKAKCFLFVSLDV